MGKLRETFGKNSEQQKADRGGKICEGKKGREVTNKHRKEPKNTIERSRGRTKGRETITNHIKQKQQGREMVRKVNWKQMSKRKAKILQSESSTYKASLSLQEISFEQSPGSARMEAYSFLCLLNLPSD